ncbi:MAG: tetratricopeptide repeat protein [Alphaproteobacteria bacterium]|nr:tetratricopeptide repeat protein [Alphaproteobacteria bacterium]
MRRTRGSAMNIRLTMAALAAIVVAVPAYAVDNAKVCASTAKDGATPDMIIEACSAIVQDADNPGVLAGAYYNRGNAYFDKKNYELAIADYDHAVKLRANYASAMFNRGLAKKHLGDNAGGDADMAAAKAMNQ